MTRRGPKYNPAAMTEQPAVSVIVLGWNGRQYVAPCLTSLLAQDFDRPYEILFVDNGSTDGTADLAERHAGVRVHRLDRNYGYCLGNNKGFGVAKAGHANIIQSWYPEYAAKELEAPVDAAYTAELSPLGFVEYRQVPVAQRVVDTLFLHGVSIILKRDVVDEIGGYVFAPDLFAHAQDMAPALRLRQ